jgi:predicted ATP-grasp superfamily ATP-dependent carboligase
VALFAVLDAFKPDAVLVGSGLEADNISYTSLFEHYVVLANPPEVVSQVKDPLRLKAFCDAHDVRSPEITMQKPHSGQWLSKQAGQCGGNHVYAWPEVSHAGESAYWQALQPGRAVGILFVAHAGSFTLIGVHALRQHVGGYAYAGATRLHDRVLDAAADSLLNQLVPDLRLVGINSIDAIWHAGSLHVIEVNPRLSASMRLYRQLPLIQAHIASCKHQGLPMLQQHATHASPTHASHCIAYARQEIDLRQLGFPDWLEDRPSSGKITAGQPLCSLYAEGYSDSEVLKALQDKKTRLEKLWGTYVCDRIEFNIH